MGKPCQCVTRHPGELSLAISHWVGAVSTSEIRGINGNKARCTSLVFVVFRCKLVSVLGLSKQKSAHLMGPVSW